MTWLCSGDLAAVAAEEAERAADHALLVVERAGDVAAGVVDRPQQLDAHESASPCPTPA